LREDFEFEIRTARYKEIFWAFSIKKTFKRPKRPWWAKKNCGH
jgi:hypothetical protein